MMDGNRDAHAEDEVFGDMDLEGIPEEEKENIRRALLLSREEQPRRTPDSCYDINDVSTLKDDADAYEAETVIDSADSKYELETDEDTSPVKQPAGRRNTSHLKSRHQQYEMETDSDASPLKQQTDRRITPQPKSRHQQCEMEADDEASSLKEQTRRRNTPKSRQPQYGLESDEVSTSRQMARNSKKQKMRQVRAITIDSEDSSEEGQQNIGPRGSEKREVTSGKQEARKQSKRTGNGELNIDSDFDDAGNDAGGHVRGNSRPVLEELHPGSSNMDDETQPPDSPGLFIPESQDLLAVEMEDDGNGAVTPKRAGSQMEETPTMEQSPDFNLNLSVSDQDHSMLVEEDNVVHANIETSMKVKQESEGDKARGRRGRRGKGATKEAEIDSQRQTGARPDNADSIRKKGKISDWLTSNKLCNGKKDSKPVSKTIISLDEEEEDPLDSLQQARSRSSQQETGSQPHSQQSQYGSQNSQARSQGFSSEEEKQGERAAEKSEVSGGSGVGQSGSQDTSSQAQTMPLFAPDDVDPYTYMKVILQLFDVYAKELKLAQLKLSERATWGESVKVGQHLQNTIDKKSRNPITAYMEVQSDDEDFQETRPTMTTRRGRAKTDVEDELPEINNTWFRSDRGQHGNKGQNEREEMQGKTTGGPAVEQTTPAVTEKEGDIQDILSADTQEYDCSMAGEEVAATDFETKFNVKPVKMREEAGAESNQRSERGGKSLRLRKTRQQLLVEDSQTVNGQDENNDDRPYEGKGKTRTMKSSVKEKEKVRVGVVMETQDDDASGEDEWLSIPRPTAKKGGDQNEPKKNGKAGVWKGYKIPMKPSASASEGKLNMQQLSQELELMDENSNASVTKHSDDIERAAAGSGGVQVNNFSSMFKDSVKQAEDTETPIEYSVKVEKARKPAPRKATKTRQKSGHSAPATLVEDTQDVEEEVITRRTRRRGNKVTEEVSVVAETQDLSDDFDVDVTVIEAQPAPDRSTVRKVTDWFGKGFEKVKSALATKTEAEEEGSQSPVLQKRRKVADTDMGQIDESIIEEQDAAFEAYRRDMMAKQEKKKQTSTSKCSDTGETKTHGSTKITRAAEGSGRNSKGVKRLFDRPASKESNASDIQCSSGSSALLDESGDLYSTQLAGETKSQRKRTQTSTDQVLNRNVSSSKPTVVRGDSWKLHVEVSDDEDIVVKPVTKDYGSRNAKKSARKSLAQTVTSMSYESGNQGDPELEEVHTVTDETKPQQSYLKVKVVLGRKATRQMKTKDQPEALRQKASTSTNGMGRIPRSHSPAACSSVDPIQAGLVERKMRNRRQSASQLDQDTGANVGQHWEPDQDQDVSIMVPDSPEERGTGKRKRQTDENLDLEPMKKTPKQKLETIPCPLCDQPFLQQDIEAHAANCNGMEEEGARGPDLEQRNMPESPIQDQLIGSQSSYGSTPRKDTADPIGLVNSVSSSPAEPGEVVMCYVCDVHVPKAVFDQHIEQCMRLATQQQAEVDARGGQTVYNRNQEPQPPEMPARMLRTRRQNDRVAQTITRSPRKAAEAEGERTSWYSSDNADVASGESSGSYNSSDDDTSSDDYVTLGSVVKAGSSALITGPWNDRNDQSRRKPTTGATSTGEPVPDWLKNPSYSPVKSFVPISKQADGEYFRNQFSYSQQRVEQRMAKRKKSQNGAKGKRRRKRRRTKKKRRVSKT